MQRNCYEIFRVVEINRDQIWKMVFFNLTLKIKNNEKKFNIFKGLILMIIIKL